MKELLNMLDFDALRALAAQDPAAFEARRREVIDAAIARANPERQQRLRGLQWRIEQIRRRASNPLSACISLSGMMWESLAGEEGLLDILQNGPLQPAANEPGAALVCLLPRDRTS